MRMKGIGARGSLRAMVEGEGRSLVGTAESKGLDVGGFGDGDEVEQVMRQNGTRDVEGVQDLAGPRGLVPHGAVGEA